MGYAYEAADASFELLARRMLGNVPEFFDVESFRVMVERRHNAVGELVTVSEATVKVRIDGERHADGGRRQRPGERARHGAAQGSRPSIRAISPTSSWSTTRCASSRAAPTP